MIAPLINAAIDARASLVDPRHETAFRLFNGFTEGPAGTGSRYLR
jgi:hypothetical protein